jgi:hypothetical protein
MNIAIVPILAVIVYALTALVPGCAFAIQVHGGSEGVVVHQLGHVFLLASMGVFVYWLRESGLLKDGGWRYIMGFALFIGLWNIDVILMHYLDEQGMLIRAVRKGLWTVTIENDQGSKILSLIYYIGKLDHLICVPALILLYLGLKRILAGLESYQAGGEGP